MPPRRLRYRPRARWVKWRQWVAASRLIAELTTVVRSPAAESGADEGTTALNRIPSLVSPVAPASTDTP